MRFLIPTPRELRLSVIVGLMLICMGAGLLGWVVVHKIRQGDEVTQIAVSEAEQLHEQAKTISSLEAKVELLLARQSAQNRYLRKRHIIIPKSVFSTAPRTDSQELTRPKVSPAHRPRPHPKPPGIPEPTMGGGTPTPTPNPLAWLCALLHMPTCPNL